MRNTLCKIRVLPLWDLCMANMAFTETIDKPNWVDVASHTEISEEKIYLRENLLIFYIDILLERHLCAL